MLKAAAPAAGIGPVVGVMGAVLLASEEETLAMAARVQAVPSLAITS